MKDIVQGVVSEIQIKDKNEPDDTKIEKETVDMDSIKNLKILVAEDNQMNQKFITALLKQYDMTCDMAENGKIALEMLGKKQYDVLYLDMHMPVMDGLETLKRIKKNTTLKDLVVVSLTADVIKENKDKYLQMGCDYFLAKPLDRQAFLNNLKTISIKKMKT